MTKIALVIESMKQNKEPLTSRGFLLTSVKRSFKQTCRITVGHALKSYTIAVFYVSLTETDEKTACFDVVCYEPWSVSAKRSVL